uniref:Uncharacterized protein n=1 Tax=Arundo donax TaxID=35708 RepID=A0A0A9HH36_ARUDO
MDCNPGSILALLLVLISVSSLFNQQGHVYFTICNRCLERDANAL